MSKVLISILPFRVWNHMFLCKRLDPQEVMCHFCTKSYVPSKKISDLINKKLYVPIETFKPSIRGEIDTGEKIHLYAHTSIFIDKNDPFGVLNNFRLFYYESISSPFLIWKIHLDILCRVAFNVSEKFLFPNFYFNC